MQDKTAPTLESHHSHHAIRLTHKQTAALSLAAIGVVFGDIGTSPLYALKACIEHRSHDNPIDEGYIFGILSMMTWALLLTVNLKYLLVILRATNRGEGGIFSLLSLIPRSLNKGRGLRTRTLVLLAMLGAGLLFGDGLITPSISVLSAVEGLKELPNAPTWIEQAILPITLAILLLLFAVQQFGTGSIGKFFGPLMIAWFLLLAAMGLYQIQLNPEIIKALNPHYVWIFIQSDPLQAFTVLGSVVLVVTGAEALYADVGHFGKFPIQIAWYTFVLPALLLNYFGQGALVLSDASAVENPFYMLAPAPLLIPLVLLATFATIIASQAVISGVFSMTQQALQLGFLPRMKVLQTSADAIGQVYVPAVNAALCAATVGLVLSFKTSDNLAGAYGIAVVCTMLITSLLLDVLLNGRGKTDRTSRMLLALALPLGAVDLVFLTSNIEKIPQGGWFPLTCGLIVFVTMRSWMRGRTVVTEQMRRQERSVQGFLEEIARTPPQVVPGTAVFLSSNSDGVPRTLARNVRYNGVLHAHTVLMSVVTERIPRVPRGGRLKVSHLAPQLWRVEAHVGFMERADVPRLMREAERLGLACRTDNATYFLGRDDIIVASPRGMARWRKRLFLIMARNAEFAGAHFGIPPERIIELGGQVQI